MRLPGPGPSAPGLGRRHAWFSPRSPAPPSGRSGSGPSAVSSHRGRGTWGGAGALTLLILTCSVTDLLTRKVPDWGDLHGVPLGWRSTGWGAPTPGPVPALGGAQRLGAVGLGQCPAGAGSVRPHARRLPDGERRGRRRQARDGGRCAARRREGPAGARLTPMSWRGSVLLAWAVWTVGPVAILSLFARKAGPGSCPAGSGRRGKGRDDSFNSSRCRWPSSSRPARRPAGGLGVSPGRHLVMPLKTVNVSPPLRAPMDTWSG